MSDNLLYYGDNLDMLRRHVKHESVDLVYLDPPFKSNQDYNVLFAERDGTRAAAQIKAFKDTWQWDRTAAEEYHEVVEAGGRVSQALQAFRTILGENDMLAYLAMMAARLVELRRALKPTGSIYLHCDATASHYLKLLMDSVFGPTNFLNEISWKRTHAHGSSRRYGPLHDVILFYANSEGYKWSDHRVAHDPKYLEEHFTYVDEKTGRRFQPITLTGSGVRHGESGDPWRDIDPTKVGRHWALPGKVVDRIKVEGDTVQEKLEALDAAGLIYWPDKEGGTPRLKWYADELEGQAMPDWWDDIDPISAKAAERLGYPTQKPEALLDRIIRASSNECDMVLDPFCGCGTAVAVAQRLGRRWIGIDITHLAITLIKKRLRDAFGEAIDKSYATVGEPTALPDAEALAKQDPYQFQWWALGLIHARPAEQKKGADRGIDGRIYFHDEHDAKSATKQIIISVKAGNTTVSQVRDLVGVLDREKAAIGVLISMQEPTQPMRAEAASAGFYQTPGLTEKHYPRLQLLTVEELLAGKRIEYPVVSHDQTFKQAPKSKGKKRHKESSLGLGLDD